MIALAPGPSRKASEGVWAPGEYYGELESTIILKDAPSPSPRPMGVRTGAEASICPESHRLHCNQPERRSMDLARASDQIDALIERRSRGADPDGDEANRMFVSGNGTRDWLELVFARWLLR